MSAAAKGRLIGVGTGPGDPELLTLKAVRAIGEADVVAHFAKEGNGSNARRIVNGHIKSDTVELPLLYPVTTEIDRDTTGGLHSTVDDYVVNLSVAAQLADPQPTTERRRTIWTLRTPESRP